jgi:hypothetical protein
VAGSIIDNRVANADRHTVSYATPDSYDDNPVPFCSRAMANVDCLADDLANSDAESIGVRLAIYW